MRDIVWTLIVIWLIYKVVAIFKNSTAKKPFVNTTNTQSDTGIHHASKPDKDIKNAVKKHLNNEGDYIDFEEVK